MTQPLTAIMGREGDGYFSLCPGLDLASQGVQAVPLFFETAGPSGIEQRRHSEIFVTRPEVEVGQATRPFWARGRWDLGQNGLGEVRPRGSQVV